MNQEALLRPWVVQPVQEVANLPAAQVQSEVVGGHRFEAVSLVEHQHTICREEPGLLLVQNEVTAQDVMVDDKQVGVVHPSAGTLIEALASGQFPLAQLS